MEITEEELEKAKRLLPKQKFLRKIVIPHDGLYAVDFFRDAHNKLMEIPLKIRYDVKITTELFIPYRSNVSRSN